MKSKIGKVDYRYFYAMAEYGEEEKRAVAKSLDNRWLAAGPIVAQFEQEIAKLFGHQYGIATNSGSSANLLALEMLDLPKDGEVITPACTFSTVVSSILQNNLVPVFVDSIIGRYTIDEKLIEQAITPKTVAIMAPHLIGGVADLRIIREIADTYHLAVIDDSCFVSGTKILTKSGEKNIEDVRVGDLVLTRDGYRKVLISKKTGEKEVITRFGITGTPNHPFITKKGIRRFDTLGVSDILYTWSQEKSCIEEKTIIDNQSLVLDNGASITGEVTGLARHESHFIGRFGLITLEKFLKDFMSTIKTTILSIIPQTILRYSVVQPIPTYTVVNQRTSKKLRRTSLLLKERLQSGTGVKREENGTVTMPRNLGKKENQRLKRFASFVVKIIKHISPLGLSFVQGNAIIDTKTKREVYNLVVEGSHEYFANGILVHNCDTLGITLDGKKTGYYSDASTTSFYGSHIITAMGYGGMVCTSNKNHFKRGTTFKDWGRVGGDSDDFESRFNYEIDGIPYDCKFLYSEFGYNLKMNEAAAAFGLEQLKRLPDFITRRKSVFGTLYHFFMKYGDYFYLPSLLKGAETSWLAFPLTIKNKATFTRKAFLGFLESRGIQTRVLFSGNITRHPAYRRSPDIFRIATKLDQADLVMEKGFLLGAHQRVTDDQLGILFDAVEAFFKT